MKLTARQRPRKEARELRAKRFACLEQLEQRYLLASDVLQISVENLMPDGGLAQTPYWVAAHDGSFDVASLDAPAANFGGLERIAEEGDPTQLVARFASTGVGNDGVITAPGGFSGAPVFEPGEVVSQVLSVDDTQLSRYFSFASMVIPSNDAFIANLDPREFELYDAGGEFLGPTTIVIYGSRIYDAGTEVNDPNGGAAFSTAGGTSVDENGVIHVHRGLDDFIGTGLPTGATLQSGFTELTPIARITVSQANNPSGPIDGEAPKAELVAEDLRNAAATHQIQVIYYDASGVDVTGIDTNDIRIFAPDLVPLNILSVTTDAAAGTTPRTVAATYEIADVDGPFSDLRNGTYVVDLVDGQVRDVFAQASPAQHLGEFVVDIPVQLQVTIENLSDFGGLSQTPFWIAAHNGSFEVGRLGVSAAQFGGLEEIAEGGDVGPLAVRFASETIGSVAVVAAPSGFAGAPVFEPNETATALLEITAPELNRYFSFASMIIPSNDAFLANLDPRQYELFDRFGNFRGPQTITIYGREILDAGTEINDPNGGAAFTTAGGISADEGGVVRRHSGLDDFIGAGLPTGENLGTAFNGATPIARITLSRADAPSNPIDRDGPMAELSAENITSGGLAYHEIAVTYSDASGVDVNSIGVDDLEIVGNFTDPLQVLSVATNANTNNPRTVSAVYRVAPLDGQPFSTADNGLYNVAVLSDAVNDAIGNGVAGSRLGSFDVLVGVRLQVSVENLSGVGGLLQTPFWVAFHEGNFQTSQLGNSASQFPGLELIAEEGDPSELRQQFASQSNGLDGVVLAADGFSGAPVFEPGEVSTEFFELFRTDLNRYFSFASMVIPSNDAFIANLDAKEYELFDVNGVYAGPLSIVVYGNQVWDAGTEVNDPAGGAAFSTAGGTGIEENGFIARHLGLNDFIGTGLPTGGDLEQAFAPRTPIARITVSLIDNPNNPLDQDGPFAVLATADDVTQAGTPAHEIQVTYNDPSGLDLTSFDDEDLLVIGPLGQELEVVDTVVDAPAGTTPNAATVTYTLSTPDGEFTGRNNGRYAVSIRDGAVQDTLAIDNQLQTIGEFRVDVGVRIQIQVENLSAAGGLAQTPLWIGLHEGNFEIGRAGQSAGNFGGLELIAEEGDPSELATRFAAESNGLSSVIAAPAGFVGAPVIEPGEIASLVTEVNDANLNRYFSFASMVIPSNDAFVANLNPRRYDLFDANGNFQGVRTINIFGGDVYDAGTEVNDPLGGAAFSTGGGVGVDENGVIRKHTGLNDFLGTGLPTGESLGFAFDANTPLLRITVTLVDPEAAVCSTEISACSVSSVGIHNRRLAFDVNDDGFVAPLDALLLVNFINQFGASTTLADEARSSGYFYDVSDDGFISPLDVLLVINRLNNSGSGEGELVAAAAGYLDEPAIDAASVDEAFQSFFFDEFDRKQDAFGE